MFEERIQNYSAFCGNCGSILIKQYSPDYAITPASEWWCPKCCKYPYNIAYVKNSGIKV